MASLPAGIRADPASATIALWLRLVILSGGTKAAPPQIYGQPEVQAAVVEETGLGESSLNTMQARSS